MEKTNPLSINLNHQLVLSDKIITTKNCVQIVTLKIKVL